MATTKVDVLPEVGDDYHPVYVTGAHGLDSYGAEVVVCWGRFFTVLCFSTGNNDDRQWKVVAVIPEDQARFILKFLVQELL